MNTRLLRKVAKHILAEPKRLLMGDWIQRQDEGREEADDNHVQQPFAQCGTAACIAGWACILGKKPHVKDIPRKAVELLALESEQEGPLFYVSGWPNKYQNAYYAAKTPRGRARAAFGRIEHFIKTKGAE